MAYTLIFLLNKTVSSFCICKSYTHFFRKNNCELNIVLTRTVNILTTNDLIKLTMLWTTEPRHFSYFSIKNRCRYSLKAPHIYFCGDKIFMRTLHFIWSYDSTSSNDFASKLWTPWSEMHEYIEDIYSFAVNTINIVIEWNENISIFMSANVFITRDENFYGIHWKRVNFLFILLFIWQCAFLTS